MSAAVGSEPHSTYTDATAKHGTGDPSLDAAAPELKGARRLQMIRLACAFNFRPDDYIHPSRWPVEWPLPYRDASIFQERGRRALAAGLLAYAGVAEAYDFHFATRAARLALLPPAALMRLADGLGIALYLSWLTESGSRRVDRTITAAFGGDALDFAFERMPRFDAFGETLEPVKSQPKQLVARIRHRGGRLLTDFVAPYGDPLLQRLRLKLSVEIDAEPPYLMSTAQREQVAELLFICLIPERLSTWDWLF